MKNQAKIIRMGMFHHLPQHQKSIDLTGMTIRQALKSLRTIDFSSLGGLYDAELDDGTTLSVDLTPASGGGYIMSSQRVERSKFSNMRGPETIRFYKL